MLRRLAVGVLCAGCGASPQTTTVSSAPSEPTHDADLPGSQRDPVKPDVEWLGSWRGEFGGTQEFATLELSPGGQFRYQLQSGPDSMCCVAGSWSASATQLQLNSESGTCSSAGLAPYTHVYKRAPDAFAVADPAYLEHVQQDDDGRLSGPVWTFTRGASVKLSCP